jgi:integrase
VNVKKRGDKWVWQGRIAKRKYWISGTTKREVEEKVARLVLERRAGTSPTCDEFAATWVQRFPRAKDATNINNAQLVAKFARDFAGVRMDDITRRQAYDWSVRHPSRWKAVRAMFSDAVRVEECASNPFTNMRLRESRGRRDLPALTELEVAQLAQHARDTWGDYGLRVLAPMIEFAAYTGVRPGELFALRWTDINIAAKVVQVRRQWSSKAHQETLPKNGKQREAILLDPAAQALAKVPHQHDHIFFTPRGKPFAQGRLHYYFHPVRCAMGRPDLDFYELRHFFGSLLASRGVQPYDIAVAMGHEDGGKMALERYVKVRESEAKGRVLSAFAPSVAPLAETVRRKATG